MKSPFDLNLKFAQVYFARKQKCMAGSQTKQLKVLTKIAQASMTRVIFHNCNLCKFYQIGTS